MTREISRLSFDSEKVSEAVKSLTMNMIFGKAPVKTGNWNENVKLHKKITKGRKDLSCKVSLEYL